MEQIYGNGWRWKIKRGKQVLFEDGQSIVKQQKEIMFCGGSRVLLGTAGLSLLQDVNPDTSIRLLPLLLTH